MPVTQSITRWQAETGITPACSYVDHYTINALASETVTVPAGAGIVFIDASVAAYYKASGAAEAPSETLDNGTGVARMPSSMIVYGGQTFSVYATADCVLTFSWFKFGINP